MVLYFYYRNKERGREVIVVNEIDLVSPLILVQYFFMLSGVIFIIIIVVIIFIIIIIIMCIACIKE